MSTFERVQIGDVSSDETSRYKLAFKEKQLSLQAVIKEILTKNEFGSVKVLLASYGEFIVAKDGHLVLKTHAVGNGSIKYVNGISYFEPPKQVPDPNQIPTYAFEYDKSEIRSTDIPKDWLMLKVVLGTAHGGWGQMDYQLVVAD